MTSRENKNTIEGFIITCEALFITQDQIFANDRKCHHAKNNIWQCGCDGTGASAAAGTHQSHMLSTRTKRALVWIPRIIGTISLIVSGLVIGDIVSTQSKRSITFYQLLFLIGCFDFMTAAVWAIGPASVPQMHDNGQPTHIYGANGNASTCQAQGFFRQWGQTSVFLMLSLSLFYFLALIYRWKEQHLKTTRIYFFAIPLLLGFSLAVSGASKVTYFPFGCQINVDPRDGKLGAMLTYVTVPIYAATQTILILLGLTLWQSPRQTRRSTARRLPNGVGVKDRLEAEVVWQDIWFTVSYSISWPIWGVAMFYDPYKSYGMWILITLLAPLGGAANGCVYFWPRVFDHRQPITGTRQSMNLRDSRNLHDIQSADHYNSNEWQRSFRRCHWRIVKVMRNTARVLGELLGRKKSWEETRETTYTKDAVIDNDMLSRGDESYTDDDPFEDVTGLLRPVV